MRRHIATAALLCAACLTSALAQEATGPGRVGGANTPEPKAPPKLVIETAELSAGTFAIKLPTGDYTAPAGGAPNYSVPGPVVAFKGVDKVWRGHGYLETYPRLLKFSGKLAGKTAELAYEFEGGKSYRVTLTAGEGAITLDETSDLGPRNVYVFDAFYGDTGKSPWGASAGFALDVAAKNHAFVYLPCFYDKPEATINPQAKDEGKGRVGGVAVLSAEAATQDVAGFFARNLEAWQGGDTMGIQLWQHRQRPGDPASRAFLGPDTKSDSTPNPRTAPLMGTSLYEGHVTIELNLGKGTRQLTFAAAPKGEKKEQTADAFKAAVTK